LAAIGQPEQFFTSLRKSGFQLSRTIALPDHTALSADLMTEIAERFILITAKDSVKYNLQPDPRIWVIEVQTIFHEPQFITEFLKYLKQIKQSKSVTCD
jgi:tetraacyldisaccharide 4'-kinase